MQPRQPRRQHPIRLLGKRAVHLARAQARLDMARPAFRIKGSKARRQTSWSYRPAPGPSAGFSRRRIGASLFKHAAGQLAHASAATSSSRGRSRGARKMSPAPDRACERCCAVTMTRVSNRSGSACRRRTRAQSLIASGRVPKTTSTRKGDIDLVAAGARACPGPRQRRGSFKTTASPVCSHRPHQDSQVSRNCLESAVAGRASGHSG